MGFDLGIQNATPQKRKGPRLWQVSVRAGRNLRSSSVGRWRATRRAGRETRDTVHRGRERPPRRRWRPLSGLQTGWNTGALGSPRQTGPAPPPGGKKTIRQKGYPPPASRSRPRPIPPPRGALRRAAQGSKPCPIVNESRHAARRCRITHDALLDTPDSVRHQAMGIYRGGGDLGRRHDALVTVGGAMGLVAGGFVLGRRGTGHRGRRHLATASGVSRQQQVATRRSALTRTAVIGVGYLGRFHAQKYASLPNSHLVGIADPSAAARAAVAAELNVAAHEDYRELLGKVDAVSIVTPTASHFEVAKAFLEAGANVLVEKPMTVTIAGGESLIEIAARHQRILQVGHLERFNAAVLAVQPTLTVPRFIESARLAPFKHRGTDVDVVLDLMIHDIDLILSIVRSPVVSVDAIGSSVFSKEIDIANARLRFANGCVANATASRVSLKTERKLRLFQDDAYLSLDLQQKILTVIRKGEGVGPDGMPQVAIDEKTYEQGDALKAEIEAFLAAVANGRPPPVTGEDGLLALRTAVSIGEQVANSMRKFS